MHKQGTLCKIHFGKKTLVSTFRSADFYAKNFPDKVIKSFRDILQKSQKCVNCFGNYIGCSWFSRLSGNFLGCLETFRSAVWKLFTLPGNILDCPNVSVNFPYCLKTWWPLLDDDNSQWKYAWCNQKCLFFHMSSRKYFQFFFTTLRHRRLD